MYGFVAISLMLVCLFSLPAGAAQSDGVEGSDFQTDTEAIQEFERIEAAADDGDAEAQRQLAYLYDRGIGVTENAELAAQWMRRSARQNYPPGQRGLGRLFERGRGVEKNYEEAVGWYRIAAEQGDLGAQINLGRMYEQGTGVRRSEEQAMHWFQIAAEQGDARMQYVVGAYYHTGHIVEKNPVEAIRWYERAVEQNHAVATANLGYMYLHGEGVARDDDRAFELIGKSARLGSPEGQYWLAKMFATARGTTRDYGQCVYWSRVSLRGRQDRKTRNLNSRCVDETAKLDRTITKKADTHPMQLRRKIRKKQDYVMDD